MPNTRFRLTTRPLTFPRSSPGELRRISALLSKESVGGLLLVALAAVALIWANSPLAESYFALRDLEVGIDEWHLRLSLGAWAADGLLAVFFFLVGLELKREFVAGDLRSPRTAVVPIVAAVGGVLVPAGVYLAVMSASRAPGDGWAIPTATDIAFAVAVLALIGSHLPGALRLFLLTLAVVDDLIAIAIIAIFYTAKIDVVPLLISLATIAVYGFLAQRYREVLRMRPAAAWVVLLPLGAVAWGFMHASGIHATIAGVLLGFTIPVRNRDGHTGQGLAEVFEHRFRPLSAGFAVPVFAFFSAGVHIGGAEGAADAFGAPVTIAILCGLLIGKPVGITAATWLITRIRRIDLDPALRWIDLAGIGMLAGIGFTVSLLIAELTFASGTAGNDHAKVAILTASALAAVAATLVLGSRNRALRRARNQSGVTSSDTPKIP